MHKEIELKAVVTDPDKTKKNLDALYSIGKKFLKSDEYYQYKNTEQIVRLRCENDLYFVTAKHKTIEGGIEVNEETEFSIDSPEAFRTYLQLTGAERWLEKIKTGWKYTAVSSSGQQSTIELCEVKRLGWFVEIEILVSDNADSLQVAAAKNELLELLVLIQIPKENIETRYYSELLRAL